MQRFIRILMWLLFVLALFILSAYLLPRKVEVERTKNIEAPPRIVFSQINDLHNWEKWSAWHIADPNLKIQFINHGVGQDAGFIWNSSMREIGDGRLMINQSTPYDSILCNLQFPDKREAKCKFTLKNKRETTLLRWIFVFDRGFNPFARWTGLLLGNTFGHKLEEGLDYLSTVCKVQFQENTPIVELITIDSFFYASVIKKVYFENVEVEMEEMFARVGDYIESAEVTGNGSPFAVYHEIKQDTIDLECGIPLNTLPEKKGSIHTGKFPATRCAMSDYFGGYSFLEETHTVIQEWIEKRRFKLAGPPMEKYITGASVNPDPGKWHTKIYYPVR